MIREIRSKSLGSALSVAKRSDMISNWHLYDFRSWELSFVILPSPSHRFLFITFKMMYLVASLGFQNIMFIFCTCNSNMILGNKNPSKDVFKYLQIDACEMIWVHFQIYPIKYRHTFPSRMKTKFCTMRKTLLRETTALNPITYFRSRNLMTSPHWSWWHSIII